jgi:chemotaxis protein methyltransferase CheR
VQSASADSPLPVFAPEDIELLGTLVAQRSGLHVSEGKRPSFLLKVARRMASLGMRSAAEYCTRLLDRAGMAQELDELVELLANHETFFFREASQVEAFFEQAAPDLVGFARAQSRPLRLLSVGCASGEEPYSVAILERERRTQGLDVKFELLGADLCESVLERARAGLYGASSLKRFEAQDPETAAAYRGFVERYFEPTDGGRVRLRSLIRRSVGFHRVNLMSRSEMAELGSFDAILCRNVLIYFEEPAMRRALENIARSLFPHGLLLLGQTESLVGRSDLFERRWLGPALAYRLVAP